MTQREREREREFVLSGAYFVIDLSPRKLSGRTNSRPFDLLSDTENELIRLISASDSKFS